MREKAVIPINQDEIASYLKDIRKLTVMTVERERELAERMLSGNITDKEKAEIKKEILEGNLRFVITLFSFIIIFKHIGSNRYCMSICIQTDQWALCSSEPRQCIYRIRMFICSDKFSIMLNKMVRADSYRSKFYHRLSICSK